MPQSGHDAASLGRLSTNLSSTPVLATASREGVESLRMYAHSEPCWWVYIAVYAAPIALAPYDSAAHSTELSRISATLSPVLTPRSLRRLATDVANSPNVL